MRGAMRSFEYARSVATIDKLIETTRNLLSQSPDQEIRSLGAAFPATGAWLEQPLGVALVGQYDAGKSTILRALTGLDTIPVTADVTTDQVSEFDWNGLHVLDTPGIHAGYPDHDIKTYAAIDAADLLVFVITNELFDARMSKHFHELAFDRAKLREMMLVVNKMAQDPGAAADKLADIACAIAPATQEDLRATCIDAESMLASRAAVDPRDRDDLAELSNSGAFVDALNAFVTARGHLGRLTTPLYRLLTAVEAARRLAVTVDPLERAALELLRRKRVLTVESRQRLRGDLDAQLHSAVADLAGIGDQVAELVEPGVEKEALDQAITCADRDFNERGEVLRDACVRLVAEAERELEKEFDELSRSPLAEKVREAARRTSGLHADYDPVFGKTQGDSLKVDRETDAFKRARKAGDVAKEIGGFAAKKAFGEAGGGLGKAAAAAGGDLHRAVYAAGKFFGVKFRPWGAANVAKALGNAGKVVGVVGGLLGVLGQILEDSQQEKIRKQLREARDQIRRDFGGAAAAVERAFWQEFDGFSTGFYQAELRAADDAMDELTAGCDMRGASARAYEAIATECRALIASIQKSPG